MMFAKRHISIRVPWHDTGWDGCVCANPLLNGSCLKLKRIGQERDDAVEEAVVGRSFPKNLFHAVYAKARYPRPSVAEVVFLHRL